MAQCLTVFAALAEDWSLVLSTHSVCSQVLITPRVRDRHSLLGFKGTHTRVICSHIDMD